MKRILLAIFLCIVAFPVFAQGSRCELNGEVVISANCAEEQFELSLKYYEAQNYAEAAKWWRKAAEQGHAFAQFNLGYMYDNGQGVPQDYKQAVDWYRKAAEQGLAEAQRNLGVTYQNGQGVLQDYKQAVDWYRKAGEQGLAEAQNDLGVMYHNGQGVPQDYKQAADWYRKAAEQGYALAQYNLGVMYEHGQGVPQDFAMAYAFYNIAAASGSDLAVKNRDRIVKKMTPGQIEEGQAISRQRQLGSNKTVEAQPQEKKAGVWQMKVKFDGDIRTFSFPDDMSREDAEQWILDNEEGIRKYLAEKDKQAKPEQGRTADETAKDNKQQRASVGIQGNQRQPALYEIIEAQKLEKENKQQNAPVGILDFLIKVLISAYLTMTSQLLVDTLAENVAFMILGVICIELLKKLRKKSAK